MKGKIMIFMLTGAMEMAAVGITSPNGDLLLNVDVDANGSPYYTLDYKGRPLVTQSHLGIKADETAFTDGFRIEGVDTVTIDRTWEPVWGEYSTVRDHIKAVS